MPQDALEKQTRQLTQDFLGRELQRLNSAEELSAALAEGSEIHIIFGHHQWVGIEIQDDRVIFFEPASTEAEPGSLISTQGLPLHRAEGDGEHSVSLKVLGQWLSRGDLRALKMV